MDDGVEGQPVSPARREVLEFNFVISGNSLKVTALRIDS